MPRPASRAPGTRAARADVRQRRLESLAAEFALLAQRRARVTHRVELLDQQRDAARASLDKLQARMAWLARHIDALDPGLRERAAMAAADPAPPPPVPARPFKVAPMPAAAPASPPAIGRQWLAARPAPNGRPRPPARPGGGPSGGKWRT